MLVSLYEMQAEPQLNAAFMPQLVFALWMRAGIGLRPMSGSYCMPRKSVQRFCENDMHNTKDLKPVARISQR
ncbi:hypothetical protein CK216_14730 [Mesorhizobium sp. WSM3876]|nr:hypothetical protein CK216_14730 [Mesorhizobium sp. WSM3876]